MATLKDKKFGEALLGVDGNDLINDERKYYVQNLLDNPKQIDFKYKSASVTRIIISGTVANNKRTSAFITDIN